MNDPATFRDFFYASRDGLKLYARDYGDSLSPWTPVVCLPGLTRTARDFHALAVHLASHRHRPRRVIAFDYRGRGRSAWDPDGRGYTIVTEMNDVLDGMAALNLPAAIVVGTSRGGVIGMLMAIVRPTAVTALVLNDVGPELDQRGLARIKTYVGQTPNPETWTDAATIQRRLHGGQFTSFSEADWDSFARLSYADENGRPAADYDGRGLAATFADVEPDQPAATLWDEFRALAGVPVLTIHGANSDLLTPVILEKMRKARSDLEIVEVAGEGHPPRLAGAGLLGRIAAFVTAVEGSAPAAGTVIPRGIAPFSLDDQSSSSSSSSS
jgi:pimeloyl-ACP methyl ester carboxylesterase